MLHVRMAGHTLQTASCRSRVSFFDSVGNALVILAGNAMCEWLLHACVLREEAPIMACMAHLLHHAKHHGAENREAGEHMYACRLSRPDATMRAVSSRCGTPQSAKARVVAIERVGKGGEARR